MRHVILSILAFGWITAQGAAAHAQTNFATSDQLSDLSADMARVSNALLEEITEAHQAMRALPDNANVSDKSKQIDLFFDGIEAQAVVVLETVSLNSDFRDALDDARSEIIALRKRNELDEASAGRDRRLQRLDELKVRFDEQYDEVSQAERTIITMIANNTDLRNEIKKDAAVDAVADIVTKLEAVTAGLTEMVNVLQRISETAPQDNATLNTLSQN